MKKQTKSKKRVADHGEVFTSDREVNAMLDLVKQETERIDSRFLEPACGTGNFLAEILRRKLAVVKSRYGSHPADYERYAVSAGTVITLSYGVFIILPKQGMHDAVMAQVESFVEQQQKAMENYLQDQYEIAKGAIIKTAPTGEILLAMCQDAETVMSNMEAGLAAQ